MKTALRLLLLGSLLLTTACRRHTIIPDDELALIFHDAFLTNAYHPQPGSQDSLNLYEPIFARYGYTTSDVQYTIGNFSKRKSARLGDVVELAIARLEEEGKVYNREVGILDTINRVAERTLTRQVYADSLRLTSLRDTGRVHIVLPVEPGTYRVEYDCRVDSADRNNRLQGHLWLERTDGATVSTYLPNMYRGRSEHFSFTFRTDTLHRRLHLNLITFPQTPRQPSVTISGLKVTHTPETAAAVEALYREQSEVRIFADEFFGAMLGKEGSETPEQP